MSNLLRDSSRLRQPPPGTQFALSSLVFVAGRTARFSGGFAGFRPAFGRPAGGGTFSPPLGDFELSFGLGFSLATGLLGLWGRAQDAVYGGGDDIDRRHAVHGLE